MIAEKFSLIEAMFADNFRKESEKINRDFSDIVSSVYLYSPEDEEASVNCCIGIDVIFQNVSENNSDNLSLQLDVEKRVEPKMNVRIAWGHPTGEKVSKMFEEPVVVTENNLKIVQDKLPEMIEKLRKSIQDNPNGK